MYFKSDTNTKTKDNGNNCVYFYGACYPQANTPKEKWQFKMVRPTGGKPYFETTEKNATESYSLLKHHSALYRMDYMAYMNKEAHLILNQCPSNLPIPEIIKLTPDQIIEIEEFCNNN